MRRVTGYLIWMAGLLALNCESQPLLDQMNFRTGEGDGIRLYGVSAFSGYSTSAYPYGLGIVPGAAQIGGDVNYGASASIGWQHHRELSNFAVLYSPSYSGEVRYSNLNSLNHSLQLTATRKVGSKWSLSLSGSGQDISLTQFLFSPSPLAVRSQAPLSFDDLAAAFAAGQFTSSQVASMLTGATPPASPAQNLLYGNKVLSYSGEASVVYAYSSRLSFHIRSYASGSQPLRNGSQVTGTYLVNHSIGADGGASISYSLSPRTEIGIDVREARQLNRYQSADLSTATGSIGRKMGMHWFLNLNGGYTNSRETKAGAAPPTNQVIGSASLGFKTYQHTLTASYSRSSTDSYGFIGTATTMGSSWRWSHPGSDWAFSSSVLDEQTRNTGFVSLSGVEVLSGVTRKLTDRSTLSAQYAFLKGSSNYSGTPTHLTMHSVRLSVGWSPQVVLR